MQTCTIVPLILFHSLEICGHVEAVSSVRVIVEGVPADRSAEVEAVRKIVRQIQVDRVRGTRPPSLLNVAVRIGWDIL